MGTAKSVVQNEPGLNEAESVEYRALFTHPFTTAEQARKYLAYCVRINAAEKEQKRAAAQVAPAAAGTPIILKRVQRKIDEVPALEVDAAAMARQSLARMHTARPPEPEPEPGSAVEYSRHHALTTSH